MADGCRVCGAHMRYTGVVRIVRGVAFGKHRCHNQHVDWPPSKKIEDCWSNACPWRSLRG